MNMSQLTTSGAREIIREWGYFGIVLESTVYYDQYLYEDLLHKYGPKQEHMERQQLKPLLLFLSAFGNEI